MTITSLKPGESYAGLLVDGVPHTPFVGATLKMTENGIAVEVPYAADQEQFHHVRGWFPPDEHPPENMRLYVPEGEITLFGNRWTSHSRRMGVSLGTIQPTTAVLADVEGDLSNPLLLTELRSDLDGLREWTRQTAILDPWRGQGGAGLPVTFELSMPDALTWEQGDAQMRIQTEWKTASVEIGHESGYDLRESTRLTSEFPEPVSVERHLTEQRKVASLLTLLFGTGSFFRRHQTISELFPVLAADGKTVLGHDLVDLIDTRTVRDHLRPIPSRTDFHDVFAHLDQVGQLGLEKWSTNYSSWYRFIGPASGVFEAKTTYLEEGILLASMSIEAAGLRIGSRTGEEATYRQGRNPKPTTATYFFRCLELVNADWGERMGDRISLARGMAHLYNDIKHAGRGDFPDAAFTRIGLEIMKTLIRLIAMSLLHDPDKLLAQYRVAGAMWKVEELAKLSRIHIASNNRFAFD